MQKQAFTPTPVKPCSWFDKLTILSEVEGLARRAGFTLIEIIIVVIVVGILATVAIPTYQIIVEKSKEKICETNLNILKSALDIYIMEHDTMPASLSELPEGYIENSYTQFLQQKGAWRIKLAYFILGLEKRNLSYAEPLINILGEGNTRIITCPSDLTPPEAGGFSYAVNNTLANMRYRDYKNLSGDILLIGDCENSTFTNLSELSERHRHIFAREDYSQSISKSGNVEEVSERGRKRKKKHGGKQYGGVQPVNVAY